MHIDAQFERFESMPRDYKGLATFVFVRLDGRIHPEIDPLMGQEEMDRRMVEAGWVLMRGSLKESWDGLVYGLWVVGTDGRVLFKDTAGLNVAGVEKVLR